MSFLFVFSGDVLENLLYATNGKLSLHQIRPVQAIYAISSENSHLLLNDFFLSVSFPNEEAEFGEYILQLRHELIDLVESVSVSLSVEVVPDMLHGVDARGK